MLDIGKYKWYIIGILLLYIGVNFIIIKNLRKRRQQKENEEGFQNPNSVNPLNNKTVQFDSNYYLREDNKSVLVKKTYNVVPMRCNTYNIPNLDNDETKKEIVISTPITYLDKVVEYIKRKVYPVVTLETISSIDTIHQLINDNLDIAFVNEELLLRYYNKDCNYLKQYLNEKYRTATEIEDKINYQIKPLNFSVISTAFYQDMYLFVPVNSKLRYFWDFATLKNQTIGVYRDSYYYFKKLMKAYIIDKTFKNQNDISIEIYDDPDKMIQDFKDEEINGFFIVSHPKNQILLKLTKETEVRLLHLQKRLQDKTNEEEEDEKFAEFGEDMTQEERLNALTNAAIIEPNMKNDFNIIIKKVFQSIVPRSINLNSFYKTANPYTYVETYSLKMVLVMRNKVTEKYGKMLINNYFDNLENIKNDINMNYMNIDVDNYNIIDFDYKDTISFYKYDLPIHPLVKDKYVQFGFIKNVINKKTKWVNESNNDD